MALPILDGNQSATTLSTILTGGAHIPAHTVVSLGSQAITDMRSAVSGSVVSISNFPASQTVAGTVTANVVGLKPNGDPILIPVGEAGGISSDSGIPIAFNAGDDVAIVGSYYPLPVQIASGSYTTTQPISGTVTANVSSPVRLIGSNGDPIDDGGNLIVDVTGTVAVGAMPSGALTTRFGSVTTASVAQLTGAVTNSSRKFLLVQNIATSTVTIGIGFAPTTTQGIQLTAGAGLTFDAFCPTGGVWWLSSTTGSNFSILEG
jgi:hypothetical protein